MVASLIPLAISAGTSAYGAYQSKKAGDKMANAAMQAAGQQSGDIGRGIDEMRGDIGQGINYLQGYGDKAVSVIKDSYGRAIPILTDAYGRAIGDLDTQFNKGVGEFGNKYDAAQNYLRPMISEYDPARKRYLDATGVNGAPAQQAYYDSLQFGPGFDADRSAGIGAIEDSRAASGMLRSGGTGTALMDYGMSHFSDYLNKDRALVGEQAGRADAARGQASALAGNAAPALLSAYGNYGQNRAGLQTGLGKDVAGLTTGEGTATASIYGDQGKSALDALTKQGIITAQARAGQGAASGAGIMNAANANVAGDLGAMNYLSKFAGQVGNMDFSKFFKNPSSTTMPGTIANGGWSTTTTPNTSWFNF